MSDIRHALRTIRRMPGLAAIVSLSLGVGIGVNVAIFSWIESFFLTPLPGVAASGRLYLFEPRGDTGYPGMSWPEFRDLRARLTMAPDLVARRIASFNVGEPGHVERTFGEFVSGNLFPALGVTPARGRFLTDADVEANRGAPLVVISHRFWQTRLGGEPAVVGRTVRVNGRVLTVIGVAPAAFQGTITSLSLDLWVPATLGPWLLGGSPRELDDRGARAYGAIGFLRPGATRAQAQAELDAAMRRLAHDHPATNATMRGEVLSIADAPRGPQRFMVMALGVLQSLMALLLLAVCGNAAILMLARATARQREMGVRLALGAGRARIVRMVLTESLILALAGAAIGAVIAVWATAALRDVPLPGAFPIEFHTSVDVWGLMVAGLLGLACGAIVGVMPALQLSRADARGAVRVRADPWRQSWTRDALMAGQIAFAMMVLVAAGLFVGTFTETQTTDPGFRRDGVWLAAYDLTGRRAAPSASLDFARRLLDDVRALPAVRAAAIASSVPLDLHGMPSCAFTLEGRGRTSEPLDRTLCNIVTPGYFDVTGIRILAGTDFVALDDVAMGRQVIVNEEFVRRFAGAPSWPTPSGPTPSGPTPSALTPSRPTSSTSAPSTPFPSTPGLSSPLLGRRLEMATRSYVIAGVVANSRYEAFGEPLTPMVYFSYRDRPMERGELHVRTRSDSGADARHLPVAIRAAVRELDPELPLYNVRTMREHIEQHLVFLRIPARLFAVLGPLLLALAGIGVYAVVAHAVAQRTAEIGVRLALGATTGRVVRQLVRETLTVVGGGAVAGWSIAWVVQHDIVQGAIAPAGFIGVPLALLAVATLACWWPAQRVSAVNPVTALRHE